MMPAMPATNVRLNTVLGRALRFGTVLAAAIIFAGIVWSWVRHDPPASIDIHHFVPSEAPSGMEVLRGLATFEPRSIILLGVVVLVLTPMLRVLSCAVVFAVQRDKLYVIISLIVAATLLLGMLGILA